MEATKVPWYELNMGGIPVASHRACNISWQSREVFRPARLTVLTPSADDFTVDEVVAGKTVLWKGPWPASKLVGEGILLDTTVTVTQSMFLTVSVTNHSHHDSVFRAVVAGLLVP
jgi:hypothetical protein